MAIMQKGIKGINDLAEMIAGSSYWSKVAPGMKQLQKEVGERIIQNGKATDIIPENNISAAANILAKGMLNAQGKQSTGEEFEQFAKTIAAKISSEADIENILKSNESIFGGRSYEGLMNAAKNQLGAAQPPTPEVAFEHAKTLTKIIETPKAYFTHPDKDIRNTRIGTAVAGYAAVSIGGRVLSGGSLTRDSYGRNDIAGVPFI